MIVAIFLWVIAAVQVVLSRGSKLTGLDRLLCVLGVATIIQFGPMFSSALHAGHGIYSYSQSSCKLMFYTEYGTRSLIACIIVSITAYSWVGLQQGFDSVDSKIRNNMGWIILTAFAIQGLFGMAPAVYLDVDPWTSSHCIWAENVSTEHERNAMEMLLRPIVPYIIPSLLLIYPLYRLITSLVNVEEPNRKATVKISIILAITYIAFNSLYAGILLVEQGLQLTSASFAEYLKWSNSYNGHVLCNLKWVFHLIHQGWFIAAPATTLLVDPALGNVAFLREYLPIWKAKLVGIYDDRARLV